MNLFEQFQSAMPDYSSLNPVSRLQEPSEADFYSPESAFKPEQKSITMDELRERMKVAKVEWYDQSGKPIVKQSILSRSEQEKKLNELLDMGFVISDKPSEQKRASETTSVSAEEPVWQTGIQTISDFARGSVESAKERIGNVKEIYNRDIDPITMGAGFAWQGVGLLGDVIFQWAKEAAQYVAPETSQYVADKFSEAMSNPTVASSVKSIAENWDEFVKANPTAATWLETVGNTGTGLWAWKVAKEAGKAATYGLKEGALATGIKSGKEVLEESAQKIAPTVDEFERKALERAVASVDTSKVKTYAQLSEAMSKRQKELVKEVDAITDASGKRFKKLVSEKTYGEWLNQVKSKRDLLKEAITLMKKESVGDNPAYWESVAKKVKTDGLTATEINEVTREFLRQGNIKLKQYTQAGTDTSGKVGEQIRELRSSLKEALREQIGDPRFKKLDAEYSDIATAKGNIDELAGKVSRSKGTEAEPGIVGSAVAGTVWLADAITGRGISSVASGLAQGLGKTLTRSKKQMEKELASEIKKLKQAARYEAGSLIERGSKKLWESLKKLKKSETDVKSKKLKK